MADPRMAKYQRMLKMHLPRGAVEQKMRADGLDPSLLDSVAAAAPPPAAAPAAPAASVDPRLAKYQRMLKMHLPRGAVEQKMRVDGLDPSLLDSVASAAPPPATAPPAPSGDPRLAKYERMLKMHLPRGAVEQKMRADGVDPALLDCGSGGGGGGASPPPAARRR